MSNDNAVEVKLRSVSDLSEAYEWLFNQQKIGKMDGKTADALNTTLKGATYLRVTMRLKVADMLIKAQVKKVDAPNLDRILPELIQAS